MKSLLSLVCLTLWLSACAGPSPSTDPAVSLVPPSSTSWSGAPSPSPTPSPRPTIQPTPPPTSSLQPTPNCLDAGGRLQSGEVSDKRLTRTVPFIIYLPPCYDQQAPGRYPTLYLLHGLAEDDHEWVTLGITDSADRLVHAGVIPPFLIVMPWERTGLDMELALTDVLVPYIDQHYRTLTSPANRGVGGLSRGGGWALHIGLRHLDQFGVIGLHSPAPFGVDLAMLPRWVERQGSVPTPKIWIDIGDHDTLLDTTRQLTALLDGITLEYTFVLGSGWHDADYWSKNVGTYLRWYGAAWGPTP
jgi:enterochelin esterase-like enzyme